jgi:hypothetical protein
MTIEDLLLYYKVRFGEYKAQIFRLIKSKAGRVLHAGDSDKLEGLSLADLIAIMRGEVNTHENNHNLPHGETLAQLGGITKATFDQRAANYFPKDGVPISKLPAPTALPISGSSITVNASNIVYCGRKVAVPAQALALSGTVRQYIKITMSGQPPAYGIQYTLSTNPGEDIRNMIVGWVDYSNGSYVPTFFGSTRIGYAVISTTPRGLGIPTSAGSQAAPSSTNPGWYS